MKKATSKKELRDLILENRKNKKHQNLSTHKINELFQISKLHDLISQSTNIALYESWDSEPDTKELIKYLESLKGETKKKILVPYPDFKLLEFVDYQTRDTFPTEKIDLFFIPALAISKDLNRLGRGGGWYDRILLNKNPSSKVIALIFENELYDSFPFEPESHDIKVDDYFLL